jgi:hypothetical protein
MTPSKKTPQEMVEFLGDLGYGGAAWAYEAQDCVQQLLKENATLRGLVKQMGTSMKSPSAPSSFRERVRAIAGRAKTEPPRCPKCRGEMQLRTNRNDGTRFWGCLQYPDCRGTTDSYAGGAKSRRYDGYDAQAVEAWSSDHNLDEDEES